MLPETFLHVNDYLQLTATTHLCHAQPVNRSRNKLSCVVAFPSRTSISQRRTDSFSGCVGREHEARSSHLSSQPEPGASGNLSRNAASNGGSNNLCIADAAGVERQSQISRRTRQPDKGEAETKIRQAVPMGSRLLAQTAAAMPQTNFRPIKSSGCASDVKLVESSPVIFTT